MELRSHGSAFTSPTQLQPPLLPKQCSLVKRVYLVAVGPTYPNLLLKQESLYVCAGVGTKRQQEGDVEAPG